MEVGLVRATGTSAGTCMVVSTGRNWADTGAFAQACSSSVLSSALFIVSALLCPIHMYRPVKAMQYVRVCQMDDGRCGGR